MITHQKTYRHCVAASSPLLLTASWPLPVSKLETNSCCDPVQLQLAPGNNVNVCYLMELCMYLLHCCFIGFW